MTAEDKLQELQLLEQNLQHLLMQKQAFQLELSETTSALEELQNAGEEIFKIIGQLMIKSDKKKIKEELENKMKILNLRIKSFEKQEDSFSSQLDVLRGEIMKTREK